VTGNFKRQRAIFFSKDDCQETFSTSTVQLECFW